MNANLADLVGRTFLKNGKRYTVASRIYVPMRDGQTRVWCESEDRTHSGWFLLSWFDDAKEVAEGGKT